MFNIKPDGTENDTFLVGSEFRQIALIKNLKEIDSSGSVEGDLFTGTSANLLRYMRLASIAEAGTFTNTIGKLFTSTTSGVSGWVDNVSSDIVYFHQNDSSGFGIIADGDEVTSTFGGSGTADSANLYSTVNPYSGEILYIENRAAILRDDDQEEDIKVIVTV